MHQVITANRLRDGLVVFLSHDHRWVERLQDAAVFTEAATSTEALKAAQKDEAANIVLDIYAIDVARRDGGLVPVRLREAIRAQGPTVHPEHGKIITSPANHGSDTNVSI